MNRKETILSELNEDQLEALLYFDGPLRIIAGAGSGKTRVLTRKIAYLINEMGISPLKILAVTFTNKAANEMNERVRQYTGETVEKMEISTFHSLCAKILRKEAFHLNIKNDFQIIDESDKKTIFNQIFKRYGLKDKDISYRSIIKVFSNAKNNNFTKDELVEHLNENDPDIKDSNKMLGDMFEIYNNYLKDKKCLDFDDLIIKVKELFDKFPELAKIWAQKYSYILVDEFQDTSRMQYDIVKYLVGPETQITIVGDPDQTIYTWRGADVNLILNFDKDFKNTKTIILKTNYRSSQKILEAANKLIQYNKKRFNKNLITDNEVGEDLQYAHAFSAEAEARWVVQKINELKKKKIQLKNIAIFYRSNYYSRPFEEELIKENINHKIFNGQKFFQRREIKDALAFLRVIYDGNDVSLIRIINVPPRKIGETYLEKLVRFALEKNLGLYETLEKYYETLPIPLDAKKNVVGLLNKIRKYRHALKNNKISVVLNKFLDEIGYLEFIENDVTLRGTGIDNVKELINSIETWEKNNSDKSVKEYLETVSLISAGDEYDNFTNYVTLMTVHSAKGLEFDNIFLVGMSEKIFPHYRVLNSNDNEQMEEERRLVYVAITRAKDRLFISDSRGHLLGTQDEKMPSRFISEMGIDLDKFILQSNTIGLDYSTVTDEKQLKEINKKIIVGDVISHTFFGEGTVLEVDNDTIKVRFVNSGSVKFIAKNHPSVRLLKNEGN